MLTFPTKVAGIPCQCRVISHEPYVPMHVYGPGMGDASPPEGGEIEFELLDRKGYLASWLQKKLTSEDSSRIEEECLIMLAGAARDYD